MLAYNHEQFVGEAIDSVLMQKTGFPIELVIGEDCSTDKTRQVVQDCARARPDIIRPLLHERNVGMNANVRATLAACKGEYIACLEGDDFWTSSAKLQLQVDYLQTHSWAAGCFHQVSILNMTKHPAPDRWPRAGTGRTVQAPTDLTTVPIPTCSLVFRRSCLEGATADTDLTMFLELLHHGPIEYLHDCMATYRVHGSGFSAAHTIASKRWDSGYLSRIVYLAAAHSYERRGDLRRGARMLWRALLSSSSRHQPRASILPWLCRLQFPRAYRAANRARKLLLGGKARLGAARP